jgi:hypothetical protein
MKRISKYVNPIFGLFLFLPTLITAQSQPPAPPKHDHKLQLEIKTEKPTYAPGETVRFRILLINKGQSAPYLSKRYLTAYGPPGFHVSVKQITGKAPGSGCASDMFESSTDDLRTPERVLAEDYLRFWPGAIIGSEGKYDGCEVRYAGAYEISATYSVSEERLRKVQSLPEADQIIGETLESKPFTFHVRAQSRRPSPKTVH